VPEPTPRFRPKVLLVLLAVLLAIAVPTALSWLVVAAILAGASQG
jgi:hypothetical protein